MDQLVTAPRDYIRLTAAEPFAWGRCDCFLWVSDYVRARAGWDPAAAYRGRYGTAFEARRLQIAAGGFASLVRSAMARAPRVQDLDGVALARIGGRVFCGLVSSGRLWIKADRGVVAPDGARLMDRWGI